MTQQQIGYINAMTQRENLAIAKQQADASTLQAKAAMEQAAIAAKRQKYEENKAYNTNLVTGLLSTAGGLLAAILL